MTDHDETRPDWDHAHALSGAYAVDALDDFERVRFEAHLRACTDCRIEVESFRETSAALAFDPVEPPAAMRANVLAGIESIRPLPPLIEPDRRMPADDRPTRRPWYATTGPLLVAAALVLVALVTTVALRPWASDGDKELSPTDQVLQADDRQNFAQEFPDGSKATVAVSRSEGRAVIITDDMALAPEGQVYELWFQDSTGTMVRAGLMPDDEDATVLLDGDASEATAVGITVEPDGGSDVPGPDVVAVIEITA